MPEQTRLLIMDVMKQCNRVFLKVASRYWKTTYKFEIEIPTLAKLTLAIDKRVDNNLWECAIKKEMDKI